MSLHVMTCMVEEVMNDCKKKAKDAFYFYTSVNKLSLPCDNCVLILSCVPVFIQSKSVSSTDSQPTEERQGPSGGYSSSQGGAEAKRRRCDDKESLPPHSYVCICFPLCTHEMY